jgi:hypothetical protein
MFGERAGVIDRDDRADKPLVRRRSTSRPGRTAAAVATGVATNCVLAEWNAGGLAERDACSSLTAGVLLDHPLRLFQAGRPRARHADRIYLDVRISASTSLWCADAAASGTGIWRAARCTGRDRCTICWATSPATPCSPSGDVAEIIHPDDARSVTTSPTGSWRARSTSIDRVFRMRHADGQWGLDARPRRGDRSRRDRHPPDRHRHRRHRAVPSHATRSEDGRSSACARPSRTSPNPSCCGTQTQRLVMCNTESTSSTCRRLATTT